jgi:hypothetical protein
MKNIANGFGTKSGMAIAFVIVIATLGANPGCASREVSVGFDNHAPPTNSFVADPDADDGNDGSVALPETVPMCPVTTCTLPWTTCPSSQFPCSTNLLSDDNNCGGCGIRCPGANAATHSQWSCVDGQCVFSCTTGAAQYLDCDNDPTNGCETYQWSTTSCGACGVTCDPVVGRCDAGKGCVNKCIADGKPDLCSGQCVNLQKDDKNCGTCGTACDRTGPGLTPLPADMYYGCDIGQCGVAKCTDSKKANCNGNVSDGCEVALQTDDNCRSCGDTCGGGKHCRKVPGTVSSYACLCADDAESWCSGACVRLGDDPLNCGGCSVVCPGTYVTPHFVSTCTSGVCGGKCEVNYANCDGIMDNGCEVNTVVDNRNCGACGNACLPEQVCSQGKCQVTPCDAGTPPVESTK